jgi:hypothetical protein
MSQKYDNFFKSSASKELTQNILKSAQIELGHNKQRNKSKIWFLIVGPVLATVAASIFVFNMSITQNFNKNSQVLPGLAAIEDVSEDVFYNSEQLEFVSYLGDDLEAVDMLDELGLLQEFDEIELITEEELEG